MKITDCDFLPIEGGWYLDDKAAIESDAVSDYYLLKGKPKTKGFRSVREPGSGVGVLLHLETGQNVYGEGTSVTYAGAAGRDPILRLQDLDSGLRQHLSNLLIGNKVTDFLPLCDAVENLSYMGNKLHTGLRYAVSQALLEGLALARECTKMESLAEILEITPSTGRLKFGIQGGEDRYVSVDKAIYRRVDAFPHALIHHKECDLGKNGDSLVSYTKWIKNRLAEHGIEESYHPTIHFDCYGTLGRAFNWDVGKVADYIVRLEKTVSPYRLQIESPIEMDSQSSQIMSLGSLKNNLSQLGSKVTLIADEWCNTLEDVIRFSEAGVVHMIQVKMPDLGAITQSAKAVMEIKKRGLLAYLGGSCNETDLNAKNTVHVALATSADQVLAKPGMGVDEGISIMRNEESRIRALIKSSI